MFQTGLNRPLLLLTNPDRGCAKIFANNSQTLQSSYQTNNACIQLATVTEGQLNCVQMIANIVANLEHWQCWCLGVHCRSDSLLAGSSLPSPDVLSKLPEKVQKRALREHGTNTKHDVEAS